MNDSSSALTASGQETPVVQQASVFEVLGGEPGIRSLVDRFYDIMDVDTELAVLRAVHGSTLDSARDKLFWYLCGYFGGPQLYIERFGHPRLRARHLPYSIGIKERDQWLLCMGLAMQELNYPPERIERLLEVFFGVADWMRNRDD